MRGWAALHAELAAIDAEAARRIHATDAQRIQRALEVYRLSGRTISDWRREGLAMIPTMEEKLKEIEMYMDSHRVLVFYYKIACLYFGAGEPAKAIDYLNNIINWKLNLRDDLQCYARLLHLIAHFELGNMEVVNYLSKSVYRFMGKMDNLSTVEEVLFNFLKQSIQKYGRAGVAGMNKED